jgi:hypothetical protein
MLNLISQNVNQALMITAFVFMMMIAVEYLNVLTGGIWQQAFRGSPWKQYLLAGLLGATPGCLGAFTVVALYSHRVVGLGALVAAMIATSGDESFVMFAMLPKQALFIHLLLFVIGCVAGLLADSFLKGLAPAPSSCPKKLELHTSEECRCFSAREIIGQWRNCTLARASLAAALLLFLVALLFNQAGPTDWSWIKITMLLVTVFAFFIVVTVPDHFLEEHLWQHVARVHVPRIFLWTAGALFAMHLLVEHLRLAPWIESHPLPLMAMAALMGLIPESGPHLIFLTLYLEKTIPLSILLVSSIVQDGRHVAPARRIAPRFRPGQGDQSAGRPAGRPVRLSGRVVAFLL